MNDQITEKPFILAVDDEQLNIELLRFILERNDFTFKGTNDDDYFFELLGEKQPDLILLDVIMPRIEGFELCEKIKSYPKYKNIPVIFLTGKVNVKDKVKEKNQLIRFTTMIIKPDKDTFMTQIDNMDLIQRSDTVYQAIN